MTLLQPIALGVFGSLLIGAGSGAARAQTLNAEAIAQIAQAITVRIEGAIQGSGVLIQREGNRYTVLTAWHVVSGQRAPEELSIYTSDGQGHTLEQGSIKRLGQVDLATLSFTAPKRYLIAQVSIEESSRSGGVVFVAGYPLPSSAVTNRLWRFLPGSLIAKSNDITPSGNMLLYSNPTLPGMSGGPVLDSRGELIGIHSGAERADQISEMTGKAVATGTNYGVPISYYKSYLMQSACTKEGLLTANTLPGTYVQLVDAGYSIRLTYRKNGTWTRVHTGNAKIAARFSAINIATFNGFWRLDGDMLSGQYTRSEIPRTSQIWNDQGESFLLTYRPPGSPFADKIASFGCNKLVFLTSSGVSEWERISD